MRKSAIFLFAAFFLMGTVNAQDDIIIGAKGGLNIANVAGEDNPAKFVPHVGGFFQFPINETFLIVPEIILSWQGHGKEEFSPGATSKLNLTYLNIPVAFRYNITYNIHAFAGPQVGFLLSGKSIQEFSGSDPVETDITDFWKSTDFGIMFGAGLAFMDQFQAYLRYTLGVSNNIAEPIGDETRRNNVFQIGIGVNLHRIEN